MKRNVRAIFLCSLLLAVFSCKVDNSNSEISAAKRDCEPTPSAEPKFDPMKPLPQHIAELKRRDKTGCCKAMTGGGEGNCHSLTLGIHTLCWADCYARMDCCRKDAVQLGHDPDQVCENGHPK